MPQIHLHAEPGDYAPVVILRPAHIVGPHVRNAPSKYLRLRVIPALMGFDPMVQLIHEEDVCRALVLALPYLQVRRLAGRRQADLREVWPEVVDNLASAVRAGMSLPEYTEFIFDACLLDWDAEEERMRGIKARFDAAGSVRIVGEGTDLTLGIEGREGVVSAGFRNMPDGEVFYSPVEDSTEGVVAFTEYPAYQEPDLVENVRMQLDVHLDAVGLRLVAGPFAHHLVNATGHPAGGPPHRLHRRVRARQHLVVHLHVLDRLKPANPGSLRVPMNKVAEHFGRRGVLVLVSDLYEEPDAIIEAIGTTTVSCTATDALQRQATCEFNVTVTKLAQLSRLRFMAFGDSITFGVGDDPARALQARVRRGALRGRVEPLPLQEIRAVDRRCSHGDRYLTRTWFERSPLWDALREAERRGVPVLLTTDHGSIHCHTPATVFAKRDTTSNLRYKFGDDLRAQDPDSALVVDDLASFGLPSRTPGTRLLLATGDRFFVYPTKLREYQARYRGAFLHGGVSPEEVLLPIALLTPRHG